MGKGTLQERLKHSKVKRGLWQLLPPSLLSLLTSSHKEVLFSYEDALRGYLLSLHPGVLAFYLSAGTSKVVRDTLTEAIMKKYFPEDWSVFKDNAHVLCRILLLASSSPSQAPYISRDVLVSFYGFEKVNVILMTKYKFLERSSWPGYVKLSPKGHKFVLEFLKAIERQYSTFYVDQLAVKKEKGGNLFGETE